MIELERIIITDVNNKLLVSLKDNEGYFDGHRIEFTVLNNKNLYIKVNEPKFSPEHNAPTLHINTDGDPEYTS